MDRLFIIVCFIGITISANAAQIDAGLVESVFSIQLQSRSGSGFLVQERADVFFRDGFGGTLASSVFIDDINTDLLDWNLFSDTRVIISGTRSIDILLSTSRTIGESSDGHFDEVSLMLSQPVPIPAAAWLFASGLIGLIVCARKNKVQLL